MDIISELVAALTAAMPVILSDAVSDAAKGAYEALKTLVSQKFRRSAAVAGLEEAPNSQASKDALIGALREVGAERDQQFLRLAQALVEALRRDREAATDRADFKIGELTGLRDAIARNLSASGNVSIDKVSAGRDAVAENIHAGNDSKKNRTH